MCLRFCTVDHVDTSISVWFHVVESFVDILVHRSSHYTSHATTSPLHLVGQDCLAKENESSLAALAGVL
jgi:hypothetical protein